MLTGDPNVERLYIHLAEEMRALLDRARVVRGLGFDPAPGMEDERPRYKRDADFERFRDRAARALDQAAGLLQKAQDDIVGIER